MNKYIIKNCPALLDGEKYGKYNGECCDKEVGAKCEHCKDCLFKQIIDMCNDAKIIEYNELANDILSLFNIEEV